MPTHKERLITVLHHKEKIHSIVTDVLNSLPESNLSDDETHNKILEKSQDIVYHLSCIGTIQGKNIKKIGKLISDFQEAVDHTMFDLRSSRKKEENLTEIFSFVDTISFDISDKRPFVLNLQLLQKLF